MSVAQDLTDVQNRAYEIFQKLVAAGDLDAVLAALPPLEQDMFLALITRFLAHETIADEQGALSFLARIDTERRPQRIETISACSTRPPSRKQLS